MAKQKKFEVKPEQKDFMSAARRDLYVAAAFQGLLAASAGRIETDAHLESIYSQAVLLGEAMEQKTRG